MDGFTLGITIPIIVSIRKATVIDEAYGWINSADCRIWPARQGVCFNDSTEGVFARKIVVEGEEFSLLLFG